MALSPPDQKRLRVILDLGHALERTWPGAPAGALDELKNQITALAESESEDLKRLAFHSRNLTADMSAKHLSAILVPFARLHGRAIRDDEFLVEENDRTDSARVTAPMIVIADNIRSAFNVGSILRTAEAFGAEKVWLTGYTPTPEEEKTSRTSMGAQHLIPWQSFASGKEAIEKARGDGYTIVALETAEDAAEVGSFDWPEKCALVLGNERFGVDHETLSLADKIIRIPLYGQKNSLNVGIAFGIAAADWRRTKSPVKPIGVFRSSANHPYEARRQATLSESDDVGTIELFPGHQFEQALEDLNGFEKIWLVYQFHKNANWKPKVLPPRGPRTKRGVFATRSPYRPSPIGLSCVDLVKVEGRTLFVKGFDLLNETPIYDIKPYLPYADAFPDARAGWTEGLDEQAFDVEFSGNAAEELAWLEAQGVSQLRGFLKSQLQHDPLDDNRKRVESLTDSLHCLSYRTWRAEFTLHDRVVRVERIYSGYSPQDLAEGASDRYGDKTIHREFNLRSPQN